MTDKKSRFRRVGALMVAAVGLAALALPIAPAKAQIGFGCGPFGCAVGLGPFGIGAGNPYYGYYGPYWGRPYYAPYPPAYWW